MIKLTDLLREIEAKSKEQEIIDDLLGTLNEGAFDDLLIKAKEYAKKGLLTAGVLAALMASPQLSSAQKAQVKDIALKTTVSKIPITPGGDITSPTPKEPDGAGPPIRDTTAIDGKIGNITSQFIFPESTISQYNYLNGQLVSFQQQAYKAGYGPLMSGNFQFLLNPTQMNEWNDFVKWMKVTDISKILSDSSGVIAGNNALNFKRNDLSVLDYYRKYVKPGFWIKGDDDVKKVQETLKAYRAYKIGAWLAGQETFKMGSKLYNPNNSKDREDIDKIFMPWAK